MRTAAPFALSLAFALLVITSASAADTSEAAARFLRPLDALGAKFATIDADAKNADPLAFADALLETDARSPLFTLEILTSLYSKEKKSLADYHDDIKDFEDAIGAYAAFGEELAGNVKRLKKAGKTDSALIARLTAERDEARVKFAAWLRKSVWLRKRSAYLDDFRRTVLDKLGDLSDPKDRRILADRLAKISGNIRKNGYFDMTDLEGGIHELRRQLRWISMGLDALDGLYVLDDAAACPVRKYAKLLDDADLMARGFSSLKPANVPSNPCVISRCLFAALAKSVHDLGDLKDDAFIEESRKGSNTLPRVFITRANVIKRGLADDALLTALEGEISACY